MCTVTFIPVGGRVFITSNRDEKSSRLPGEPPLVHRVFDSSLLFPKDGNKGGTWICANKKGDCGVLLNGARKAHLPQPSYLHSRGIILPQLLAANKPVEAFEKFDAQEMEPFTLVLFVQRRLYECRWDGTMKSINRLPAKEPHIWSSSTLYNAAIQEKRKAWFEMWLQENPSPDAVSIQQLHRFGGDGIPGVDFILNRNDKILTVSITSIILNAEQATMNYYSLADNKKYRTYLSFSNSITASLIMWLKKFAIRLFNWEYWPFHFVYAPIYLYWFWLCMKARSMFFFTASNPTIRNGGFLMESKKEIYDLIPAGNYPKTILVKKNHTSVGELSDLLFHNEFSFPVIAKPDIGLRGIAVKLVRTFEELESYHHHGRVDYLLQAYVPYENEVGIFYCRIPGSKQGQITGIVGKELLHVIGDGLQTIGELMKKEKRFFLQLDALQKSDTILLAQVLNNNERKLLVPYGNHSRGARFIDLTNKINESLLHTINSLCLQIPGFYFGRLDIRYNTWDEFCAGKNFSVIELNGAGSEPAHMYDPQHSIFFGWKEIIRHWNLLYRISRKNQQMTNLSYPSFKEGVNLFRENAAYMRMIS